MTILAGAAMAYHVIGASWWLFAALFLVPDISMLGYLRSTRFGAMLYNAGHTYAVPGILLAAAPWAGHPLLQALALIWIAHIGFDRLVGYGLKYGVSFNATHLGWVGRRTPG